MMEIGEPKERENQEEEISDLVVVVVVEETKRVDASPFLYLQQRVVDGDGSVVLREIQDNPEKRRVGRRTPLVLSEIKNSFQDLGLDWRKLPISGLGARVVVLLGLLDLGDLGGRYLGNPFLRPQKKIVSLRGG